MVIPIVLMLGPSTDPRVLVMAFAVPKPRYDICILIFAYFGLIFKKLTKRNKMGCLIDI